MAPVICDINGPRRGLYGTTGWLRDGGIFDILEGQAALRRHASSDCQYLRFSGLTGEGASCIKYLLPEGNLASRQNGSPQVQTFLELAYTHPGDICVCGYLIMAPRHDERLSIDALTMCSPLIEPPGECGDDQYGQYGDTTCDMPENFIWKSIQQTYGLTDCVAPEEIQRIPLLVGGEGARLGWWLWWD